MKERVLKKEITTNLKSFTWIGYILIIFAIVYTASSYYSLQLRGEMPEQAFSGGIVALVFAAIFMFIGSKKRKFSFYEKYFEYKTNKVLFTEDYANIVYLKTFAIKGKDSANILFATDNDVEHKLSSAFLGRELIKDVFLELYENCSKNEEFDLEDELNWLGDGR